MAKPEWWSDEGLKVLSARVVRAVPNDMRANTMRAMVLNGQLGAWEERGLARQRSSGRRLRTSIGLQSADRCSGGESRESPYGRRVSLRGSRNCGFVTRLVGYPLERDM